MDVSTTPFQRMFEVRLLHHYWLDDGATVFDALPSSVQAERLLTYDVRTTLEVAPTPSTQRLLDDLGCRFRATGQGFFVAAPSGLTLALDTQLHFVVTIADGPFFDYTALTLHGQPIREAFDPTDHAETRVVHRYKEGVALLSNVTGAARGAQNDPTLFLSRDYDALGASDEVEALLVSGATLTQLTSDGPGATTLPLGSASQLPVYLNQADAPVITPPAGTVGAPQRGVLLSDDVPDHVYALIQLRAARSDDNRFSFVDASGAIKGAPPVFQVRFKNRATVWTYLDQRTGVVRATEPVPLPLTFYGNAGTKQKPSRGIVRPVRSGGKVTALVSEIRI